jgi:hypothetical protein
MRIQTFELCLRCGSKLGRVLPILLTGRKLRRCIGRPIKVEKSLFSNTHNRPNRPCTMKDDDDDDDETL